MRKVNIVRVNCTLVLRYLRLKKFFVLREKIQSDVGLSKTALMFALRKLRADGRISRLMSRRKGFTKIYFGVF
jgi:hypothetical protein